MSRHARAVILVGILGVCITCVCSFNSCQSRFPHPEVWRAGREASQRWYENSGVAYATTTTTTTEKLQDLALGKVVQSGSLKFVKVADNQYLAKNICPDGSTYSSFYKGCVVRTTDFAYTGGEQTFTAPADGYYVLEVWGAQGGNADTVRGGYGGYSIGLLDISDITPKLFIQIGGHAGTSTSMSANYNGGYNGGGYSWYWRNRDLISGAGGGATHIATVGGLLTDLLIYRDTGGSNVSREILIVAGGGGGSSLNRGNPTLGGNGGGINGASGTQNTTYHDGYYGKGGTQTNGGVSTKSSSNVAAYLKAGDGSFGKGGDSANNNDGKSYGGGPAGGAGWYGGGGATTADTAGGGSGYIASSSLLTTRYELRHMTCYNCATSTDASTYTISNTCANATPTADCAKIGNGAARITQLSAYLGI